MRVLNHKYWPYRVTLANPLKNTANPCNEIPFNSSMTDWCDQQDCAWHVVYRGPEHDFYFVDEAIALMFRLRWQ
jgi:hypothetical protein